MPPCLLSYTWPSGRGIPKERQAHSSGDRSICSDIEKLPLPEKAVQAFITRLRSWAEADDGKPVYMFNLIHFFPKLQPFPGAPDFKGTPEQANAYYEKRLIWLWLSHASYPTFIGVPQAKNLINMQPERTWGNMTVVRYPNRRTFLKLISHPAYAPLAAYKFMAVELDLLPVSKGMVVPDLRWVVGASFVIDFPPGRMASPRRFRITSEREIKRCSSNERN